MWSGIGGSGRQSATKLATYMADFDLFLIEISRNYTMNEWREDIKRVGRVTVVCWMSLWWRDLKNIWLKRSPLKLSIFSLNGKQNI